MAGIGIYLKALGLAALLSLLPPANAAETATRGSITGGVAHQAPDWFKESFLEIADDVDDATDAGKHVLLFFQLNDCPYCDRMLEEGFESEPLRSYIQQHFDSIAINVRGDRDIAFNEEISVSEKPWCALTAIGRPSVSGRYSNSSLPNPIKPPNSATTCRPGSITTFTSFGPTRCSARPGTCRASPAR
jgi:hypothetical protein